ncbi:MAG: hypothetical protein A2798_01780 [Candidatus Levybacteria bacterium RIFCSPHIGHO2_01_FULL_37_17]|nr:MAG: hypothetical protein A2798_01780 [Candidatus Levybacteria bacterium RIFCSPHIGHO2_01_FULL_37_17]OGH37178.1 MAG: hypothetical protein A2959_02640 [Candidatus Levybacteria bacterium RIFCSPLOWO2_01_FULL_38_23]
MKQTLIKKFIVFVAVLSLIAQSISPYVVSAQEVTTTETPAETVDQSTPTDAPTPTPVVEQGTPTHTITPTPSDTQSETVSQEPTDSPTANDTTQVDNLSPPSSTSALENQASSGSELEQTDLNTELNMVILDNVSAESINSGSSELLNSDTILTSEKSASLVTDKADYFPDDAVFITGRNFFPNTTYKIIISSEDLPPVHFEDDVNSNEEGSFIYAYQLDGIERLNYKVEVFDSSNILVASITFTDTDAKIDVTKTAADSTINSGDTATYTISVDTDASATGTTAQNVVLTDQLPVGSWTLGGADAASCSINGSNLLTCNFGDMPKGQTKTITVSQDTTGFCGVISNDASATAINSRNGNTLNASDNNNKITVEDCIDVSVNKTADDASISAGAVAHYNIIVKNESDQASGNFTLTDNLPSGTSGLVWEEDGASGFPTGTSCTIVGNLLTCTINSLASGASKTIQVKATTDIDDCGVIDNTATITVLNDGNSANNSDSQSITLACKDVEVTKVGNGPINVGDSAQFTIVVSSVGGESINDVVLDDILPPGTWAVNYTGGSACDQNATGSFQCTNIDLGVSGSRTYTVTRVTTEDDCPALINEVSVSAATEEGTTSNNSDSATIDLNGCEPETGSVKVNKIVDGNANGFSDEGSTDDENTEADGLGFSWSLDGSGTNTMGSPVNDVEPGEHSVDESSVSGYHFVGWFPSNQDYSCESLPEPAAYHTLPAVIEVEPGETNEITICNAIDNGTLIVHKVTDPTNDLTEFTITATGSGTITAPATRTTLATNHSESFTVTPGTYDVNEEAQSGWSEDESDCQEVAVASGQTAECTIYNTKLGSVLGSKFEDADGDTDTTGDQTGLENWVIDLYNNCGFDFIGCVFYLTTNTLSDGSYSFTDLIPDYYQVREVLQAGWTALTSLFYNITLTAGDTITGQDFVNFKNIDITVCKVEDVDGDPETDEDQSDVQGWEMTLNVDGVASGSAQTTGEDGCYTFTNLGPNHNYSVTEEDRDGWTPLNDSTHDFETPTSGQNESYTFINTQEGQVIVTKYNDEDGNGLLEGEDPVLSDWTINLTGQTSQLTDPTGTVTFNNLIPGTYTLGENLQDGWEQTAISCGQEVAINEDDTLDLFVSSGQTVFCQILNHNAEPLLTISKENDAVGDKNTGDVVTYTLTLTVDPDQGPGDNITATDLLPDGFSYNGGSYQVLYTPYLGATTDITGSISEPTYASPGTWTLGSANPGDVFTLIYKATIGSGQAAGTYYDNAWAKGTPIGDPSSLILALAVNPGDLDTADPDSNFVGTEVSLVNTSQPSAEYKATQEVLGASTELPATGENTIWVIMAALLLGTGTGSLLLGLRLKKRYEK